MGILRRQVRLLRGLSVSVFTVLIIFGSVTVALSQTTGVISGTVRDAQTHAPIAGVRITAAAATGTFRAVSDARGFYSMAGVYSDTYTISFQADGYEPVAVPGISVSADQTQTVNETLVKSLRTIARVTARSAASAFQPNQTVDTYTVNSAQIQTVQGNALNISESNLITSLPGASYDAFGYPVIHGGRENEEGFEFEGIPYVDAFTNQFTNTLTTPGLGLQSAQLTPGAGNASFGNTGTGTLNLVAKRGSYPGYATAQGAIGFPNFFHGLNAEFGTAAANGRWSEYVTLNAENTSFKYGDGSYPAAGIFRFNSTLMETDREFLNNFIYHFGRANAQSIQLFADIADHHFYQGYGGNPYCFKTCDPIFTGTVSGFTGLTPSQVGNIMTLDPYQTNVNETLAQAHRSPYAYYQPNQAFKFEYTNNLNSSTFLTARWYRGNAVVTFDQPYPSTSPFAFSQQTLQGGQTTGGTIALTSQLNQQNLVQLGIDYAWLHPVYDQPSNVYGIWDLIFNNFEQYDFISPTDPNCPLGSDVSGASYCGYLYKYFANGAHVPPNYERSITNRQDLSLFLNDKINVSPRLKAEIGVRMDGVNYRMPGPGINPATCTTDYLPATWTPPTTWNPGQPGSVCNAKATFNVTDAQIRPRIWQPRLGLTYNPTSRDSIRMTYGRSVLFPPLGQVDWTVPASYYSGFNKVPSFVNPGLAGDPTIPANSNALGPANCGIPGFQVACASYGDQLRWDAANTVEGVPLQPIKPETFSNWSLTLGHDFGGGVSISLAPWYRRGFDATASTSTPLIGTNGKPVINPVTGAYVYGPAVQTNRGTDFATGVDFRLTKEAPYGFSGQWSMTYINEFSNVIPLSIGEDFFPTIPPASLALGNLYRVGFISPFQTNLSLQYKTRNGWRINPQIYYDMGYPIGSGTITSAFINGTAYNIANTNASGANSSAPNGSPAYIDPMNPDSLFKPNIAATRGTPEGASAGGKLSSPDLFVNATVEWDSPKNYAVGFTVNNVFNSLYTGSYWWGLNDRYQPVATGIAGPLTGYSTSGYSYAPFGPSLGLQSQYGGFVHGREPYLNIPNALPRTFYLYFQVKM